MALAVVKLKDLNDTAKLAKTLSSQLANCVVFLMGTLGSGKTTFVRNLVEHLPGGEHAEVASPSFTLCNIYPTSPEVIHFDLYRLPPGSSDENLEDALDSIEIQAPNAPSRLILIEWAEHMPKALIPENRLELYWHALPDGREVIIKGEGSAQYIEFFKNNLS